MDPSYWSDRLLDVAAGCCNSHGEKPKKELKKDSDAVRMARCPPRHKANWAGA